MVTTMTMVICTEENKTAPHVRKETCMLSVKPVLKTWMYGISVHLIKMHKLKDVINTWKMVDMTNSLVTMEMTGARMVRAKCSMRNQKDIVCV